MKRQCRRWTPEEDAYLEDRWGTTPVMVMAEKLGRTVTAVNMRANKLWLGPFLEAGNYVTLASLMRAIGCSRSLCSMDLWIRKGLPVRYKQVLKRRHKVVDLEAFWKWAEKNRSLIDFSKFEPLALGREPAWVARQRKVDGRKRNSRRPWSIHEELQIMTMIEHGAGFDELAKELKRTVPAVMKRCAMLGVWPEKIPHQRITWKDEEKEILRKGILNGDSYEIIADRLGRSTVMVTGFAQMTYGTQKLDRLRSMLK